MVTCNRCRKNKPVEEFTKFMRFCDDCWDRKTHIRDNETGEIVDKDLIY